jgi:hypothetical protein
MCDAKCFIVSQTVSLFCNFATFFPFPCFTKNRDAQNKQNVLNGPSFLPMFLNLHLSNVDPNSHPDLVKNLNSYPDPDLGCHSNANPFRSGPRSRSLCNNVLVILIMNIF